MYREITEKETTTTTVQRPFSPLAETAETIRNNALSAARLKLPYRQREHALAELLQRRGFVEHFKAALAQEIAQVIAAHDHNVQSVYLFEESTNPDAETEDYLPLADLTIHLLALVTTPTAALASFTASLDKALTAALGELPAAAFARRSSFLNLLPVTAEDVSEGRGYAVLLSSFYAPPLKIWKRD
ncbi:MAG: hypothetical protein R3300_01530 [Candidatus Promineifilaceae bacterium]|nr:hypothetical protein [Candidatus Promineifilaceae bacterium]